MLPDGRLEPGGARFLDGAKVVTARAVGGDEAVRRHRDFLLARLGRLLAHRRGLRLDRPQQGFKVRRTPAEEKVVGVLHPLRPLDGMDLFD